MKNEYVPIKRQERRRKRTSRHLGLVTTFNFMVNMMMVTWIKWIKRKFHFIWRTRLETHFEGNRKWCVRDVYPSPDLTLSFSFGSSFLLFLLFLSISQSIQSLPFLGSNYLLDDDASHEWSKGKGREKKWRERTEEEREGEKKMKQKRRKQNTRSGIWWSWEWGSDLSLPTCFTSCLRVKAVHFLTKDSVISTVLI